VKLTIDGTIVEVDEGTTVLEAARSLGKEIPTLCHDDKLKPFASCFVCVVQIEGKANLVPSCSTPAAPNMVVETDNERIRLARRTCLELLLSDHVGDCVAPCREGCPGALNIPGFISHLNQGQTGEAIRLIKDRLAMPAVLGRVCPRPCEEACRRILVDEQAVAICELKRFAADADLVGDKAFVPEKQAPTGKKVAIVGAGPGGVSAAYYLQQWGHQCTIFEAQEAAGGMLRYGIPSYRLPRDIIEQEVAVVEQLGAEVRYNHRIGRDQTLEDLRASHDALFIAVGAQSASTMRVAGEDSPGVLSGIDFLAEVSRNEKTPIGRRVMVVGGGNTAIDAARTSIRLGSEDVRILYRRTRKEMPAWEAEIHEAEVEGVQLDILAAPTKIEARSDGALDVTCIGMELGEPDQSGRRRPMPMEGSEFVVTVDNVIAAIGQRVDGDCLGQCTLDRTRWNTFVVNEQTLQTNVENVFAGGDCVIGPDIAVRAVAAGRLAACSIDQFLGGQPVVGEASNVFVRMGQNEVVPPQSYAQAQPGPRVTMPTLPVEERTSTFAEVETGLPVPTATEETARCLECGCRAETDCRLRQYGAQYGADPARYAGEHRLFARDESHPELVYEAHKCIGCGLCVRLSQEVLGVEFLGFVGRGFSTRVGAPFGRNLGDMKARDLQLLGDRCPTGSLCAQGLRPV
jgi:formate dehydrogenase major subunit